MVDQGLYNGQRSQNQTMGINISELEKLLKVELETVAPNALADQQKITNRTAAAMSSLRAIQPHILGEEKGTEQLQEKVDQLLARQEPLISENKCLKDLVNQLKSENQSLNVEAASTVKGLNLTVDDQSSKHDEDGADDKVKARLLFSNQELSIMLSKLEFDQATPEPLPGASANTSKQEGQKLAKDKLESTKRANQAAPASAAPLKPSTFTADMFSSTPATTTTTNTTTTSTGADHRQPLRSSNDFSTSYGPHSYQSNRVAKDAALLEAFLTDAGVKPEDQLSLGHFAPPIFAQTRHQTMILTVAVLPTTSAMGMRLAENQKTKQKRSSDDYSEIIQSAATAILNHKQSNRTARTSNSTKQRQIQKTDDQIEAKEEEYLEGKMAHRQSNCKRILEGQRPYKIEIRVKTAGATDPEQWET
ncbi:hypothetical protein PPACK8108_LOCUS22963 [Phakopsora pachyrhizi]|uniref:Uncharacterized protein n=1 Tax=Phakopsora pachyrhizi TaxID=170000 RepID=A0AAV0BNW2_PHAPC|nr:hypothetical protein PPACK8108_LOCUS22963 [Phakopsora pachyrhizi]